VTKHDRIVKKLSSGNIGIESEKGSKLTGPDN
jgi:hypothetical protein